MRVVTYAAGAGPKCGVLLAEDRLADASAAAREAGIEARCDDAIGVARLGAEDRERLLEAAERIGGLRLDAVRLLPPIVAPPKILCIGLNYESHAEEARGAGLPVPDDPIVFSKFRTSLLAAGEAVLLPAVSPECVDYEGELAVVIGRGGKHITEAEAEDHVVGYMPFNDVSARDLQLGSPQWTMGKAHDASAPCGPALVTKDEVPDPSMLRLRTRHNGEVVQDASTSELIHSIPKLIAHISKVITLEAGDIIATGTPAGVGHARDPKRYLRDGDTIEVAIEGLGSLSNPVALELVPARVAVGVGS